MLGIERGRGVVILYPILYVCSVWVSVIEEQLTNCYSVGMDLSIRQGETLEISFTVDDLTAETIQLLVANADGDIVINETENFSTVDGKRVATISTNDTNLTPGNYEYMLVVEYTGGIISKLPDVSECEECSLPILKVCEALGIGVS